MKKQLVLLAAMIVLGVIYVNNQKSQIDYVDMPCPNCEGVEVLNFGYNDNGEQKCHCADCGLDFSIIDEK